MDSNRTNICQTFYFQIAVTTDVNVLFYVVLVLSGSVEKELW